jgi:hypothetical protein
MPTPPSTAFHEEQRFRQTWVWVLVLGVAALQWWGWVQQILLGQPFGDNPGPDWIVWLFWALFGIGLPLFFVYLRLVVEVDEKGVRLRYSPLTKRTIKFDEIEHCEAVDYQPLRRYGGWGIRGLGSNRAYNVSGSQGVRLHLRNGDVVIIGSQRPQDLALAIDAHLSRF